MSHSVGGIAGDGIGPEVVAEAVKVLGASGVDGGTTACELAGGR